MAFTAVSEFHLGSYHFVFSGIDQQWGQQLTLGEPPARDRVPESSWLTLESPTFRIIIINDEVDGDGGVARRL